jgi:hypothetical protein
MKYSKIVLVYAHKFAFLIKLNISSFEHKMINILKPNKNNF